MTKLARKFTPVKPIEDDSAFSEALATIKSVVDNTLAYLGDDDSKGLRFDIHHIAVPDLKAIKILFAKVSPEELIKNSDALQTLANFVTTAQFIHEGFLSTQLFEYDTNPSPASRQLSSDMVKATETLKKAAAQAASTPPTATITASALTLEGGVK